MVQLFTTTSAEEEEGVGGIGEGKMKEFNPDKHRKDTSPVQVHIR